MINEKPNTVLIIADCLGTEGINSKKVPEFLNDINSDSFQYYPNTFCSGTSTGPNFGSILSGMYSFNHGFRTMESNLSINSNILTLPQKLKESSVNTYANVTGPLNDFSGLLSGFDFVENREVNVNLDKHFDYFTNIVDKMEGPFFSLIHLWDLHRNRTISKGISKLRGLSHYEKAILTFEKNIKKYIEYLISKDITVVLTGDHGEFFIDNFFSNMYENNIDTIRNMVNSGNYILNKINPSLESKNSGDNKIQLSSKKKYFSEVTKTHGYGLDSYQIRVPLFIFNMRKEFNAKQTDNISNVDIFPTICDFYDISDFREDSDGLSLISDNFENRTVYSELFLDKGKMVPWYGDNFYNEWIVGLIINNWRIVFLPSKPEDYLLYNGKNRVESYRINKLLKNHLGKINTEIISGLSKHSENKVKDPNVDKVETALRKLGYL